MGDIEIELWTEDEQSDYAKILSNISDETAEKMYKHLWKAALEWTDDHNEDPVVYKRLTGRNVDVADVIEWFEEEGHIERTKENGNLAFVLSDSVQEALETDATNRTVLHED